MDCLRAWGHLSKGPDWPEREAVDSLPLLVNYTITQLTIESGRVLPGFEAELIVIPDCQGSELSHGGWPTFWLTKQFVLFENRNGRVLPGFEAELIVIHDPETRFCKYIVEF